MTKAGATYIFITAIWFIGCDNPQSINGDLNQYTDVEYDHSLPLDSFALAIQQHYKLPGCAIATINESGISEIAIVGKNKTKDGTPLNENSKFQIASCTKSFTALLVATFVEEESVDWDTKVSDIFNEIEIHTDFKDVTIRQLLSHTTGLQQFWTDDEVFNVQNTIPGLQGSTIEKRRIFTEWNLNQPAVFTIGEHHYSNGGYVVIAALLEKLSGMPYEELMQERIFQALGLNSAEFGYPFLLDSSQPHRHMDRDENGIGITLNKKDRIPDPIFNPSGFISLSIEDFAKYVKFNIQALKGDETDIDYRIVQELFIPVVKIDENTEVGLGWQIIYVNGKKTFGHTGSDGTIRSAMSIDPESGKAVVFATNIGDQISGIAMINVILELLNL